MQMMSALSALDIRYAHEEPTGIELFPDPRRVFVDWNEHLAKRVLPVIAFDLALAGSTGKAVFLYHEDPAGDFLEWKTDGERIVSVSERVLKLASFEDGVPNVERLKKRLGGYLDLETFDIEVEPPERTADWPRRVADALEEAGAYDIGRCIRIGPQYPFYVQRTMPIVEDALITAELPGSFLQLASMYFYLVAADQGRSFQQQMQMT